MLVAQQWFDLLHPQQGLQEEGHHLLIQQAFSVLTEAGVVPDGVVCSQPHKPSAQQVVVQLFQEEPLGAQAIDGLQQQRQQQLFWWYGSPGIESAAVGALQESSPRSRRRRAGNRLLLMALQLGCSS